MQSNKAVPLRLLIALAFIALILDACDRQPSAQYQNSGNKSLAIVAQATPKATAEPQPTGSDQHIQTDSMDDIYLALKKEMLEMKRQDGRDNAIIYYIDAGLTVNNFSEFVDKYSKSMNQVLNDGWTSQSENLLPCLAQCQPAFAEIRKGAALDYARNLGSKHGMATPVPNYLAIQTFMKALCVEGRQLESQGKYDEALADYLTALTMGRDAGAQGAKVIGGLIASACVSVTSKQMGRLAASGHLGRPALLSLIARLDRIENTWEPISDSINVEKECQLILFEKTKDDPADAARLLAWGSDAPAEKNIAKNERIKRIDQLKSDTNLLWDYMIKNLDTPYWNRDTKTYLAGYDAILAKIHPAVKISIPDAVEADTRRLVAKVKLQKARQIAALALYHLDNHQYPATLDPLIPAYLKAPVIDPFSGKPYEYRPAPDGKSYQLWSIGPDAKNDAVQITYDPSNGATSAGDIY